MGWNHQPVIIAFNILIFQCVVVDVGDVQTSWYLTSVPVSILVIFDVIG